MPDEGIDDEAVVRLGDAEEGPREDVAISVAELVGGVPSCPFSNLSVDLI